MLQSGVIIKFLASLAFGLLYLFVLKPSAHLSDTANYHFFSIQMCRFMEDHHSMNDLFGNISANFMQYLQQHNISLVNRDNFCVNPQLLIVRLGAWTNFVSNNSYFAKAIVFATMGYIGVLYTIKTMIRLFPATDLKLFILPLLFIPSIVFWTSGLMKEPVCLLAIGILLNYFTLLILQRKINFRSLIALMLSIWLLGFIKPFLLIILLISLIVFPVLHFIVNHKSSFTKRKIRLLTLLLIIFLLSAYLMLNQKYLGRYAIGHIFESARTSYVLMQGADKAGSTYEACLSETDLKSILLSIPKALNTALFRPYLWESNNLFSFISAIESLALLLATIYTIYLLINRKHLRSLIDNPGLLFMLFLSLTFFYFTTISTSNFGTLVRYKSIIMPFYLMTLTVTIYKCRKQTD